MIEVLFGESEAASMKAAKTKVILGHASGPTSVWKSGKKTPPERPFSGRVEGTGRRDGGRSDLSWFYAGYW